MVKVAHGITFECLSFIGKAGHRIIFLYLSIVPKFVHGITFFCLSIIAKVAHEIIFHYLGIIAKVAPGKSCSMDYFSLLMYYS